MDVSNIFSAIHKQDTAEIIETIILTHEFKIERIISRGHTTAEGEWYNQDKNEWVLVLKGSARLLFEGDDETVNMNAGNYVNIPAHRKHRVEWTDPEVETIWLVIHYGNESS